MSPLPRPLRLARLALYTAALTGLVLLLGLPVPWQATRAELVSWSTFAVLVGGALAAASALARRRRMGWALAIGLGLLALHTLLLGAWQLTRADAGAAPAPIAIYVLGSLPFVALLVAAGCCLALPGWRAELR